MTLLLYSFKNYQGFFSDCICCSFVFLLNLSNDKYERFSDLNNLYSSIAVEGIYLLEGIAVEGKFFIVLMAGCFSCNTFSLKS